MNPRALPLPLALILVACSGGETGGNTSSTTGGEGPSETAPTGAVNLEVYTAEGQDCPAGNVHVDLGNTKLDPPELLVDAYEGASVACAVEPMGLVLDASASLSQGGASFSFSGVTSDGKSAVGAVTIELPDGGGEYQSDPQKPCVFQFAPGSGQAIAPGKVFVQFDCNALTRAGDPSKTCSSRYGYVYVDRCAK
jgi:hypothetical protein